MPDPGHVRTADRTRPHLVIAGLGYAGTAVAQAARGAGWRVTGTARDPGRATRPPPGVAVAAFDAAGPVIVGASHLLVTAAPGETGDPVIARHRASIAAAPGLRWIGYLSTTGVYGDRGGAWVDENTAPTPAQARTRRRLAAEQDWAALAGACAFDIFRVGGIYGPGRSAFDDLRAGNARRTIRAGHAFSRIHRDDIALAVLAALRSTAPSGRRVLHLVDDEPAESATVIEAAARMLGTEPPPAIPFDQAAQAMSPMALSFWSENRRVANAATKAALGLSWRHPTYREGLAAILAEERGEGPA